MLDAEYYLLHALAILNTVGAVRNPMIAARMRAMAEGFKGYADQLLAAQPAKRGGEDPGGVVPQPEFSGPAH